MNKDQFSETLHYHEIRQSFFILIAKILGVQVVIAFADFFIGQLLLNLEFHEAYMSTWEFFFSHLFNTLWLLWVIIKWTSTYYVINSKEISISTGILSTKKCAYDIRGIQSAEVTQGILGRIFKYGTIHLENPLLKSDIFLKNVSQPRNYVAIIDHAHKSAIREAPLTDIMLPNK